MNSRNNSTRKQTTNSKQSKRSNLSKAQRSRKRKRSKPRRPAVVIPQGAIARQKMFLSKCSEDYLRTLSDPFGSAAAVCIPDLLDQQSAKYKLYAKGTLAVGTAGMGFIQIMPMFCAANNGANIFVTNPGFEGSTTSTSATGVDNFGFGTAPYTQAQIAVAGPIKSRIVALGVRIRYLGTELNRGGRIILLRKPYNTTTNGLNVAGALLDRTAISLPVTKRWSGVNYLPTDSEDYEYQFVSGFENNPRLAILVESTAGNPFEYEAVVYVEYIGSIANLTPSHSDVTGMSAIREAINEVSTVEPLGPSMFNNLLSSITNFGSDVLSHPETVKFISGAATKVLL